MGVLGMLVAGASACHWTDNGAAARGRSGAERVSIWGGEGRVTDGLPVRGWKRDLWALG